jgi:hypothetical protein
MERVSRNPPFDASRRVNVAQDMSYKDVQTTPTESHSGNPRVALWLGAGVLAALHH